MKTYMAKPAEVKRKWYLIDATGKPMGRVATEAAKLLRGKGKTIFTPHVDTGDHVVIINAAKVRLTGTKPSKKIYRYHTGYPGGLKEINYKTLLAKNPEKAVFKAVEGMIPHNRLGRQMLKRLRVYRGPSHPHEAQQPENYTCL